MERPALAEYDQFDASRKAHEALLADQQDEAELRQSERKIKR